LKTRSPLDHGFAQALQQDSLPPRESTGFAEAAQSHIDREHIVTLLSRGADKLSKQFFAFTIFLFAKICWLYQRRNTNQGRKEEQEREALKLRAPLLIYFSALTADSLALNFASFKPQRGG
jgi:hypothetical protein